VAACCEDRAALSRSAGVSRGQGLPPNVTAYSEFLSRRAQLDGMAGFEPSWVPGFLFPFQRALAEWAIRMGRGALLEDAGTGKSVQELVWAQNVHGHTGRPVLLLTPLAVTFQIQAEAAKFGVEAAISRDGKVSGPVTIANYERLHLFSRDDFGGVVCDESSVIKDFDGVRRGLVTGFLRKMPYRLLATATAAPNDYVELGTSSEALGYLGYMDMLAMFFTNDRKSSRLTGGLWRGGGWRFKGHAEHPFWRWVSSWARALRRPSDLGFDDDGFTLPPLEYWHHVVDAAAWDSDGALFGRAASGLREERAEARQTITQRCERAAQLLGGVGAGIAWCQLNAEGDLLEHLIDGAVQVSGSESPDAKEAKLAAFTRGEFRVLVTKPRIGAWGLNWQHCHHMTYFPSWSWEAHYQAVRRCWRFGQRHPVTVDIITTPGGVNAVKGLQRKAAQAERMFTALAGHMREASGVPRSDTYDLEVEVPEWAAC
jgi:hypothetical protein